MNKAFVREPERTADYCPRCGAKGEPVGRETVERYAGEKARMVGDPANFCPSPRCGVAYFDTFDRVVLTGDLTTPVYPKDADAPMCACFGLTRHDIDDDICEGVVTRVKAALEKANAPDAQCTRTAANGRSCAAYVQRYYMQHRASR